MKTIVSVSLFKTNIAIFASRKKDRFCFYFSPNLLHSDLINNLISVSASLPPVFWLLTARM